METEQPNISTFSGTVTVTFSDAVVASTTEARIVCVDGEPGVFYVPFKDVYFEMLTAMDKTIYRPDWGVAHFWSISAAGEAADNFMWAYLSPEPPAAALANHGAFNPEVSLISAVPSEQGMHSTKFPSVSYSDQKRGTVMKPQEMKSRDKPSLPTDDELVKHLVETSDLSPLQAQDLIRLHGRDRFKLDNLAKSFKAES